MFASEAATKERSEYVRTSTALKGLCLTQINVKWRAIAKNGVV